MFLLSYGQHGLHCRRCYGATWVMGAVVGHWVLALLGSQVVAMAAQCHEERDGGQQHQCTPSGYNVIPVGGHGLQGHCCVYSGITHARKGSPWWTDTERLACGREACTLHCLMPAWLIFIIVIFCYIGSQIWCAAQKRNRQLLHTDRQMCMHVASP